MILWAPALAFLPILASSSIHFRSSVGLVGSGGILVICSGQLLVSKVSGYSRFQTLIICSCQLLASNIQNNLNLSNKITF